VFSIEFGLLEGADFIIGFSFIILIIRMGDLLVL